MGRSRKGRRKPSERDLKDLALWDGLKAALEEKGWTVVVARTFLDGRGGHCIVRGERRAILAGRLPVAERVDMLAELLRSEEVDADALMDQLLERFAPAAATA